MIKVYLIVSLILCLSRFIGLIKISDNLICIIIIPILLYLFLGMIKLAGQQRDLDRKK